MAGQLKIGGNIIATHAGSEGAGTVTLDSSTLTIGSNTTISGSTSDSSTTFPACHLIQTVTKEVRTSETTTSSSFAEMTGYAQSFTPKFNNSKIILTLSSSVYHNTDNGHGYITFYRDSTHLSDNNEGIRLFQVGHDGKARWNFMYCTYVDTPNTTSAVTYKVYIRTTTGTFYLNYGSNYYSNFMIQEIKV